MIILCEALRTGQDTPNNKKKLCREEILFRRHSELIECFKTGSHVTWTTLEVSEAKDDLKLLILLPSPQL